MKFDGPRSGWESRPPPIIERGSGQPARRPPPNVPQPPIERAFRDVRRYLRAGIGIEGSGSGTTINPVPIYEFACASCGHRFEELVGSHVGVEVAEVVCPECGSGATERLLSTSYAPLHRQMTPRQRRRLEAKRGTDRGGAKERFKRQRAAEKRAGGRRSGSSP
jgi:putative FmdB family regulatory protein